MSNAGTVYRPNAFPPSLDIGNATAETLFQNKIGGALVLPLQNDGQWTNARLAVHIGGRVQTTSNLNYTLAVYFSSNTVFGVPATVAQSTKIYTTGPTIVNNKQTNWQLDLNIFWDGTSKTFCGNTIGQIGDYILGQNTLIATPTADPNLHNSSNSFQNVFYALSFTGLFSGSSSGNHAFIDVCSLEHL